MAVPCLQTMPKYGISKIDNRKEELFMKFTVIGAGSHEKLMDTCEEYRIIAQTQMGDGKEAV